VVIWRINLTQHYVLRQDHARAEPLLVRLLQDQRAHLPKGHPQIGLTLALLGLTRLELKQYEAAEPVLRECLEIREHQMPDSWQVFNAKSLLGGSQLGQKKYADAEPLLLAGYEGLKARQKDIPPLALPRLKEAGQRVVDLYQAWEKPDKVKEWREKLKE